VHRRGITGSFFPELVSSIRVRDIGKAPKLKVVPVIPAFSAGITFGCFEKNIANALKSVSERFLYIKTPDGFGKVPEPKPGFEKRLATFSDLINKHSSFIAPLTKEQFLGAYVGRKRTVYENAYKSLASKPFSHKDAYVSWFLKMEKIEFKETKETVPRGISPRNPRYHVLLGPFVKRMEKEIYNVIDTIFGGKTVFKGLNAKQRGHHLEEIWKSFDDPIAIPIDAKRFDQHVSREMLEWEHSIYRMFNPSKFLARLLRLQLDNKYFANLPDGSFSFKTRGKRCSGDMTTSLGNMVIMCGMMYSFLSERVGKFRIADDGDDCIIFIERRDRSRINDLFDSILDFGFQLEIEPDVTIFEQLEFCQCRPVWVAGSYIMVRNPLKSMAKDTMSLHTNSLHHYRKWLYQVAECGLALSSGVPVMQSFYNRIRTLGIRNDKTLTYKTGLYYLSQGMKYEHAEVDDRSRLSFWRAFGITPDSQTLLEEYITTTQIDVSTIGDVHRTLNDLPI